VKSRTNFVLAKAKISTRGAGTKLVRDEENTAIKVFGNIFIAVFFVPIQGERVSRKARTLIIEYVPALFHKSAG